MGGSAPPRLRDVLLRDESGSGDSSGPVKTSVARVPSTSTLNTGLPRNSASDLVVGRRRRGAAAEAVADHVPLGAEVDQLEAGLLARPREVGEVHVGGHVLRPGRAYGSLGRGTKSCCSP